MRYSHEVGHALGLDHTPYKEDGVRSIMDYTFHGERNVINRDVQAVVSGAVQLANQADAKSVRIILTTGSSENTVRIKNQDGSNGRSITYPIPKY